MKKILLLTMLTTITSFSGLTQDDEKVPTSKNVKVSHGKAYPVVDSYNKNYFVIDDKIVSIKAKGSKLNKLVFQTFSKSDLNETSTNTVEVKIKGFELNLFKVLNNKLYMFYTVYDKPNKTEQLFAQELNTTKGGFIGGPEKLLAIPQKLNGDIVYKSIVIMSIPTIVNKFKFDFSSDTSKFVIRYKYFNEKTKNSENKEKFGMAVFSNDLEKLWQKDVQMPIVESKLSITDFSVDSRGNGYLLASKLKNESTRKNQEDPDNKKLVLYRVDENGIGDEIEFNINDNIVTSILLRENANGDMVCAGYYRKPKTNTTDGAFVAIIDKNGEVNEPRLYEFSKEFIQQYYKISDRAEKKMSKKEDAGNLGMNSLTMDNIVPTSDGGLLLYGEIFYVTTTTDSKGRTTYTYHYDHVVMVKMDKDGELNWMKKIPKRSTSASYRQFISAKYAYVAFNDNIANEKLKDNEFPKAGKNAVITYKINLEDGTHDYLTLFNQNKIDNIPVYQFSLYRIIPLSDREFAIELYIKNKQDMMFKIEFKDK